MSQAPFHPAYAAPPPPRKRPRKIWFVVGGALVVLAPLVFVGAMFTVLRPLVQADAVFSVSKTPVQVDLPAGEKRVLFSNHGVSADCAAVDGSADAVEFRPVTGEFTFNEWTAVSRFTTGDGALTFTCDGLYPDSEVRVAQLPSTAGLVGGIVVGVVGPLLLGGVGLVMLVVTAVLYATGSPREQHSTG